MILEPNPAALLLALCASPWPARADLPFPGGDGERMLNFWGFESTNWLDLSGRGPLAFTNLVNAGRAGDGNALLLDTTKFELDTPTNTRSMPMSNALARLAAII